MSATRQFAQMQSAGLAAYPKFIRGAAWVLIVLGLLISLTVIGAILGIPLALAGAGMLFVARYVERQVPVLGEALVEQAEIAEDRLRRARQAETGR